jgi:hypothetical protein
LKDYTPYQKGVIKRYYEHSETLALQKLAEIVSDLYLADNAAKTKNLWARAEKALAHLKCPVVRRERVLSEQNVEGLAALLSDLQG